MLDEERDHWVMMMTYLDGVICNLLCIDNPVDAEKFLTEAIQACRHYQEYMRDNESTLANLLSGLLMNPPTNVLVYQFLNSIQKKDQIEYWAKILLDRMTVELKHLTSKTRRLFEAIDQKTAEELMVSIRILSGEEDLYTRWFLVYNICRRLHTLLHQE